MQQYVNTVTSRGGAAISGASVLVKTYPGGATATIYSDDGSTQTSNPLTTDANGRFSFYATDGRYTLVISKTGVIDQLTLTDAVHLWDPDDGTTEQDAADVSFTQSGIGPIPYLKTVSDILNEMPVSALRFIPSAQAAAIKAGTSTYDAASDIQDAIDAINDNGRGMLELPYGRIGIGSALTTKQNIVIRGQGKDVSKIYALNDTGIFGPSDDTSIAGFIGFENFTVHGYADRNATLGDNDDRLFNIQYIERAWFRNVKTMYGRHMSITAHASELATADECEVYWSHRDAINLTGSKFARANQNVIRWCGDDAIAVHVRNGATGIYNAPVLVQGNIIQFSYGIKVLGARNASIKGNIGRFLEGYLVYLGHDASAQEGWRESIAVEVEGNQAMDVFKQSNAGVIELNFPYDEGAEDAFLEEYSVSEGDLLKPEDFWQDARTSSDHFGPSKGVSITNNKVIQSLGPVAAFSNYGVGQRWSNAGFATDAAYDGTIYNRNSAQTFVGANVANIASSLKVFDNFFYGLRYGTTFSVTNSRRIKNVEVKRNHFERIPESCVTFSGSIPAAASRTAQIEISDNLFDMDPLYELADHADTGVWSNTSTAIGTPCYFVRAKSVLYHDNTIKNSKRVYFAGSDTRVVQWGNKVYRDPVTGGGVNDGNLAPQDIVVPVVTDIAAQLLRVTSPSGTFTIGETVTGGTSGATGTVKLYDSTSLCIIVTSVSGTFSAGETLTGGSSAATATFGSMETALGELLQTAGANTLAATAIPTAGYYAKHTLVRNQSISYSTGGAVLLGWLRLTNGSGHVEGTDWQPVYTMGKNVLAGSATYNPGSLADGAGTTTTVTVTGAALGDYAEASFSLDVQGISVTAWVSASNTVSVRLQNESGGVLDLAEGTLRARVVKA